MKKLLRYLGYTVAGLMAIAVFGGGVCGDYAPVIFSLTASPASVPRNGMSTVTCDAGDADSSLSDLDYSWYASGGTISIHQDPSLPASGLGYGGMGSTAYWRAPDTPGTYTVSVTVEDETFLHATSTTFIEVLDEHAPEIESLTADPVTIQSGGSSTITCAASDGDGDTLTYTFTAAKGYIGEFGEDGEEMWTATELFDQPLEPGLYTIEVDVSDGKYTVTGSVQVRVVSQIVEEETPEVNHPPEFLTTDAVPHTVAPGGSSTITIGVHDPDGDTLTATWKPLDGGWLQGGGNTATWTAADLAGNPVTEGNYYIEITLDDGRGGTCSTMVWVTVDIGAGGTPCPGGH